MRCSELRQHLFDINIIKNKNCLSNAHYTLLLGIFYKFVRSNYEFPFHVLLYGISNGINSFIINQATQEYVVATNQFDLLNNLSWVLQ